MPDNTLATAVDAHGLLVTLERDVDTAGNVHGLHLVMSGRTAAFDPADETQRAGLVALHAALGEALGGTADTPAGHWRVSRLDRDEDDRRHDSLPMIELADEMTRPGSLVAVAGELLLVVRASRATRVLYVRPDGDR
jgi:hypothetical protein